MAAFSNKIEATEVDSQMRQDVRFSPLLRLRRVFSIFNFRSSFSRFPTSLKHRAKKTSTRKILDVDKNAGKYTVPEKFMYTLGKR